MKKLSKRNFSWQRLRECLIENVVRVSGWTTSLIILLIVVFLFGEGLGFFKHNEVEHGYVLCVNSSNPVKRLTPQQLTKIFNREAETWRQLIEDMPVDEDIVPLRMDDIFSLYPEEAIDDAPETLMPLIARALEENTGGIAFVSADYAPHAQSIRQLPTENLKPSDFYGGEEWIPTASPAPQFGLLPLLMGTLWVSLTAILIALPLGLGVAIYMAELAGKRVRNFLKPAIELLAGIPSVVYGFFGLVVIAPGVQKMLDLPVGETAFTGSLVLAIMALPTIITLAEDALRSTPAILREASLGLGANQLQTIFRVIVPYATSGILAAIVLGIGRAVGETMAVLMVTGNAAVIPTSLFEPVRTIPATIAAELGEAPKGGAHYGALFLLGCILFLITLLISTTAEVLDRRKHKNQVV